MIRAIASRDEADQVLSSWDLKNFTENAAQDHLAHTFSVLKRLPGFARIKVFRPDQIIAWSDAPTEPLVSYQINRQLSGWNLPPLVIRAFGAHCQYRHRGN
jgi:hypothetical protein